MPQIFKGSPSFKLFWSDVSPIAKKALIDAAKAGAAVIVAALMSDQFRAVIADHFGVLAATALGSFLTISGVSRWLSDNTKG